MTAPDIFELIDRLQGVGADGRLPASAPHLYVFRTAERAICRCHPSVPADVAAALQTIASTPRGRQRDWPGEYGRYLEGLGELGPIESVRAGPLYRATQPPHGGDAAVQVTAANADLLRGGLDEWIPDVEAGLPMFVAVENGGAVAICGSVHAVEGAHEAGVETLSTHRGRGFASAAVAAWSRHVLGLGAAAFYGTSFDNLASQRVATRVGLTLVGSEFSVCVGRT